MNPLPAAPPNTVAPTGTLYERSRTCLFPTSVRKRYITARQPYPTSFLNGDSYIFGTFDVGSLCLGPPQNIYTSLVTGAFRSNAIIGRQYFGRGRPQDMDFLPTETFKDERHRQSKIHAGGLSKLPTELRDKIYELACVPNRAQTASRSRERTPAEAMILNLSATSTFFHDDVKRFTHARHVFYFTTPARLAHFNRCLSLSPLPPPLHFGTIILELRRFDPPQPHTMERARTLAAPYHHFHHLSPLNHHYVAMFITEGAHTRDWDRLTSGRAWCAAIRDLIEHSRIKKLIIKPEPGFWLGWLPQGGILTGLDAVGRSGHVEEVVLELDGGEPPIIAVMIVLLKQRYGWA